MQIPFCHLIITKELSKLQSRSNENYMGIKYIFGTHWNIEETCRNAKKNWHLEDRRSEFNFASASS